MKHWRVIAVLLASLSAPARAEIIHESAVLGATGVFGPAFSVGADTFHGSRFSVDAPVQVEAIGGHLFSFAPLFGAIVALSGPLGLPVGNPFDASEVVASTVFDPGAPSSDFLTPLPVTLAPGHYGLVFGSGQLGAPSSFGGILFNNTDIPGQSSYFLWQGSGPHPGWNQADPALGLGVTNLRFVVAGATAPEPTTLALLAAGMVLAGAGSATSRRSGASSASTQASRCTRP